MFQPARLPAREPAGLVIGPAWSQEPGAPPGRPSQERAPSPGARLPVPIALDPVTRIVLDLARPLPRTLVANGERPGDRRARGRVAGGSAAAAFETRIAQPVAVPPPMATASALRAEPDKIETKTPAAETPGPLGAPCGRRLRETRWKPARLLARDRGIGPRGIGAFRRTGRGACDRSAPSARVAPPRHPRGRLRLPRPGEASSGRSQGAEGLRRGLLPLRPLDAARRGLVFERGRGDARSGRTRPRQSRRDFSAAGDQPGRSRSSRASRSRLI